MNYLGDIFSSISDLFNTSVFGIINIGEIVIFCLMLMLVFTIWKVMNHS